MHSHNPFKSKKSNNRNITLVQKLLYGEYANFQNVLNEEALYKQFFKELKAALGNQFDTIFKNLNLNTMLRKPKNRQASSDDEVGAVDSSIFENIFNAFTNGTQGLKKNLNKAATIKALMAVFPGVTEAVKTDARQYADNYLKPELLKKLGIKKEQVGALLDSDILNIDSLINKTKRSEKYQQAQAQLFEALQKNFATARSIAAALDMLNDLPLQIKKSTECELFTIQLQIMNCYNTISKSFGNEEAVKYFLNFMAADIGHLSDQFLNLFFNVLEIGVAKENVTDFLYLGMLLKALAKLPDAFHPSLNDHAQLDKTAYAGLCTRVINHYKKPNDNSDFIASLEKLADLSLSSDQRGAFDAQLVTVASNFLKYTDEKGTAKKLLLLAAQSTNTAIRLDAYKKFVEIRLDKETGISNPEQAIFFLIQLATQTDDLVKAFEACQQLITQYPYSQDDESNLGNGNPSERVRVTSAGVWQNFQRGLKQYPNNIDAYNQALLALAQFYQAAIPEDQKGHKSAIPEKNQKAALIYHAILGQNQSAALCDEARIALATLYENGKGGVAKDINQAIYYLEEIILCSNHQQNILQAIGSLQRCYANKLEKLNNYPERLQIKYAYDLCALKTDIISIQKIMGLLETTQAQLRITILLHGQHFQQIKSHLPQPEISAKSAQEILMQEEVRRIKAQSEQMLEEQRAKEKSDVETATAATGHPLEDDASDPQVPAGVQLKSAKEMRTQSPNLGARQDAQPQPLAASFLQSKSIQENIEVGDPKHQALIESLMKDATQPNKLCLRRYALDLLAYIYGSWGRREAAEVNGLQFLAPGNVNLQHCQRVSEAFTKLVAQVGTPTEFDQEYLTLINSSFSNIPYCDRIKKSFV